MVLFFLAILLVYGLLHLYIYYKIKAAVVFGAAAMVLLTILLKHQPVVKSGNARNRIYFHNFSHLA